MRIVIISEGGKKIGFGHIARCVSLYQASEAKGLNPELILNADNSIINLLKGTKYRIFNWLKEKNKLFDSVTNADFAILDSYLAGKPLYDKISEITNGKLIMIDDYNRLEYPRGFLLNPCIGADGLGYRQRSGVKHLLGGDYVILRKEFWKIPRKGVKEAVENVLITFGGRDYVNFTEKLLGLLSIKYRNFMYHVVAPGLSPKWNDDPKVKSYSCLSALGMRRLMLECDLCICAGGQTLYELARIGVPTIGIRFAANQTSNLQRLNEKGFLEYAGDYNDVKISSKIKEAIDYLMPPKARRSKGIIGRRLIDGKGAERIVAIIKKFSATDKRQIKVHLRPAMINDSRDLWEWRNDGGTRKWCFSTDIIAYKKHESWFKGKLKDEKVRIYIAKNTRGQKIGQVRFEMNTDKTAHINVGLNPVFFGRGLGHKIIKMATASFFNDRKEAVEIIAEVISDNLVSFKAFVKANYSPIRRVRRNGKKVTVFAHTR